ncbi:MAG: hypothetical protein FJ279_38880, partial [Planctomycetes bacterium]|nr:hypothetical protein [Planctomycetota bacterium]
MPKNLTRFIRLAAFLLAAFALDTAAAGLCLVKDAEPKAVIVLAEQPTDVAKLAAVELQRYVKK